MLPHHDPIQTAIDIQSGGAFSQNPFNPELLIVSAIDQKYYRGDTLTEKIVLLVLQGYTQAEIGTFLEISQQHVGILMRKIPVSNPYIVGGVKGMQAGEQELKFSQIRLWKAKHFHPDPCPGPKTWSCISEGGYHKKRFQSVDKQLERD